MTVGERIKAARKKAGLTQKELAERLFVTTGMISQYENNQNPPKIETLSRIASALGVNMDDLLKDKKFDLQLFAADETETAIENKLTNTIGSLNKDGKKEVLHHAEIISSIPKYKK